MPDRVKSFAWRLVHRPIPILLVLFFMYELHAVGAWFMALAAPTGEQAGYAGAAILAFVGAFKFYVDTDGGNV